MNQNPATSAECPAAISDRMEKLRPGDVITNLSQLFGATTDVIAVLVRFENGILILSERAKTISHKPDMNGPFYWSRSDMAMLCKGTLTQHQHVGPLSQVIKGAGLVELSNFLSQNPEAVEARTKVHKAYWSTRAHR